MDIEQKKRLRPMAREKASEYQAALRKASDEGANVHQVSIDLMDVVQEFATGISDADREAFLELFYEELQALTNATLAEAAEIETKAIADAAGNANAATIIIVVVAVLLMIVFAAR
ncbi:hypothetical protein H0A70_07925 [Alcaligenaceae bacterium]|nr:hypothetical protein [Alcaligenaceae bacterium]